MPQSPLEPFIKTSMIDINKELDMKNNNEWQFTSLELSKRMKELGFKQDSLFYWRTDWYEGGEKKDIYQLVDERHANYAPASLSYHYELISAYTVAELGEMLPEICSSYWEERFAINGKKFKVYCCEFIGDNEHSEFYTQDDTEANARAKMLIYLKENNLI